MRLSQFKDKFSERKKGEENKYHILYKTVCVVNDKFYIGIHSCKRDNDTYIGCGIYTNIYSTDNVYVKRALKRSVFWRAVLKYGVQNFKRTNLAYFKTREELMAAEKELVDREFILSQWNYNNCIGGSMPPTNKGEKNGNYGNFWTEEQKQRARDHFKETRNTKGSNNTRAVECLCVDLQTMKIDNFGCGQDLGVFIGVTRSSIQTWLGSAETLSQNIRRKRFICFRKEDFDQETDLKSRLLKTIDQSNSLNQEIKQQYTQNVKNYQY